MTVMPSLMSDKLIETYGIKAGAELIRANRGRQRLEAVTSSYRALEGARSLTVHVCCAQRNPSLGAGQ